MKKNTFTVLFSKFGVALFFLMFLLWNEGQAQSYVNADIAKTRLSAQSEVWRTQLKQNPNQAGAYQLNAQSTVYQKMILHLNDGATVAESIDAGAEKLLILLTADGQFTKLAAKTQANSFKQSAESLLSN